MTSPKPSKVIAVVVSTTCADRATEALRGAIGLTLRGDHVVVVLTGATPEYDPTFVRHRIMLASSGHTVTTSADTITDADAIEAWTDPAPRVLQLRHHHQWRTEPLVALSPDDVVTFAFDADAAAIC